jgi:hypothetical protein
VTSVLVGAIIGFLIFNFHPAKIFMGDSGSLFIGFLLAAVAVQSSVKRALLVPVIALALPIVDTCMAIIRRWSKGLPMSVPDRQHVHHRLIAAGFTQRQAVFILYSISVVLGCAALVVALLESRVAAAVAYSFIFAAILGAVYVLGGREIWTLINRIRNGWQRKRMRNRGWTQVYQAVAKMDNAASVEQMWGDLAGALEAIDVDLARVRIEPRGGQPAHCEWTRPGTLVQLDATGCPAEGWTLRLPIGDGVTVRGEIVIGKDTRRGALGEALGEMVDVLRAQLAKSMLRLTVLQPAAGAVGEKEKASVS